MPLSEVERRTLWLSVWHSDMFGRNDFLGEVLLPLRGLPFDDPAPEWHALQDRVSLKARGGREFAKVIRAGTVIVLLSPC